MTAHTAETNRHTSTVTKSLLRQANTELPYRKMFSTEEFPKIAAAPMMKIPVPKKNEDAMETAKYLLKMIFRKVYRLAQPRLISILPRTAHKSEPTFTAKEIPVSRPAAAAPIR